MSDSVIKIRKGLELRWVGAPSPEVQDQLSSATVAVMPLEYDGLKPRLLVKEGDVVKRGTAVIEDKKHPGFKLCAPAAGTIRQVVYGPRRIIEKIVIAVAARDEAESFPRFTPSQISSLPRETVLEQLQSSGLLALLRQRPFSVLPHPAAQPKAIFINGMSTAPFLPDLHAAVRGAEAEFQAGLDVLKRLTEGPVYLCLAAGAGNESPAVTGAKNVEIRRFSGPHPAGNTSVHIHHLAPIAQGETVWTVRAVDVSLIGSMFLAGELPATRVISLAGPGLRKGMARHYRVRMGCEVAPLLRGRVEDGESRVVAGDLLTGTQIGADGYLPFRANAISVVMEDRRRHFLGWMAPGFTGFSHSPLFMSTWLRRGATWELGTNRHGSERPMIATGLYDRYLPMKIMSDYLLRAILAKDWEEAIQLGLLEVDSEDFALPAFVCPSKMDLIGIVRRGLAEAEAEGL